MASVTPSSKPFSQVVDGFQIPGMFSAETFRSAMNYKPQPGDIFLVTYPKCGTTWTTQILELIFSQGVPATSKKFWSGTPFIEITGAEGIKNLARPGAIKTHIPYRLIPRSDTTKYIYVTRNPKDCCVSYFHHLSNNPGHYFNGTFDEFFELFISGTTDYGDYFDHLLEWYPHRNDPNVLFVTYEEMKEHPEEAILKMASFIDDKVYAEPLRNDPSILQNIIKYSSIDHMRETVNKSIQELFAMPPEDVLKSELPELMKQMVLKNSEKSDLSKTPLKDFIRKGIIGDWKNYFTEEQNKRLKEKFEDRTKGTDLLDLWGKFM